MFHVLMLAQTRCVCFIVLLFLESNYNLEQVFLSFSLNGLSSDFPEQIRMPCCRFNTQRRILREGHLKSEGSRMKKSLANL